MKDKTQHCVACKRVFDLLLSIPVLILVSPVIIVVTLLVRMRLGSPVFFSQLRPGLHARPFYMLKFRTMTNTRGSDGRLLSDDKRMTRLGNFLRRTSIDELPEFVNVFKGDMSLVGPRPLLMQYLDRYTPEQARRHEVKPGITGWAQIHGRNALTWEEKFKLDVWYVDNWGIWLDIKIIIITLWKVLKREGINHPGMTTMSEFKGESTIGRD